MKTVEYVGTTKVGAPANWNLERDGPCHAIDCFTGDDEMGPYYMSTWVFTTEEATAIAKGGVLTLVLRVPRHPVIQIGVIREDGSLVPSEQS